MTSDCFECVTPEEYQEYVACWFDETSSCGENIKAELRSAYLLVTSEIYDFCGCGNLCSDELKEAVYIQCYYANNRIYADNTEVASYQLTPECYSYCVKKELFSA